MDGSSESRGDPGKPNKGNSQKRKYWRAFPNNNYNKNIESREKALVFYLKESAGPSRRTIADFSLIDTSGKSANKVLPSGWQLYFNCDDKLDHRGVMTQIKAFQKFVRNNPAQYDLKEIRSLTCFSVDVRGNQIANWNTFEEDLIAHPSRTLASLGLAMHLLVNPDGDARGEKNSHRLKLLTPRLFNLDLSLARFKNLRLEDFGQLVCVRGTVIKVNECRLFRQWMAYECVSCKTMQIVMQNDGKVHSPTSCRSCKSRSNFKSLCDGPFSYTQTQQILKLQEVKSSNSSDANIQSFVEVMLTQELVDTFCPGDDVTVIGIMSMAVQQDHLSKQYSILIKVVNAFNNKQSTILNALEFSTKDLAMVNLVKAEPCPFRLLVHSLCPKIFGHEMTKAGLLLSLFSGSNRGYTGRRREAHILLVGDPGMGKSELLQACAAVAPRGVFVSSNNSTKSGLTATLQNTGKKYALEAGALVQADQGVCCIDEFDKIAGNQEVMLEVMDQQCVSVTKAGVACSLNAKTCIVAAANPVSGHYDKRKTIIENLKISLPLLSSFDLVFILIDKYDEKFENQLSDHIKKLYVNGLQKKGNKHNQQNTYFNGSNASVKFEEDTTLLSHLKLNPDEKMDLLKPNLFLKYINYARQKCLPILTPEAMCVIKEFYLNLRKQPFFIDTIPVTSRQLEALIRLTQARARIDLSEKATDKHARQVIEIINHSMQDVRNITEEDILLQTQLSSIKSSSKSRLSVAKQLSQFTRYLQIKAKSNKSQTFSTSELREVAQLASVSDFDKILHLLNDNGVLLFKGRGNYELSAV